MITSRHAARIMRDAAELTALDDWREAVYRSSAQHATVGAWPPCTCPVWHGPAGRRCQDREIAALDADGRGEP